MINSQATGIGSLYIVATPIGNREDITLRAIQILKSVDFILAEDTRHSMPLLTSLGIKNKISSLHAHNEGDKSKQIVELLLKGQSAALISDAGTPLISDPGYPLVALARQHQIPVIPIPGACAVIAALSAAGVPCDAFSFLGFLPAKQKARKDKLASLSTQPHTLVFYESTHRIIECLDDVKEVYGEQSEVVLAKELTKSYERFISGTVVEVSAWLLEEAGRIKGEFVLIIPPRAELPQTHSHEKLLAILLKELPLKRAVSVVCEITGGNKNEIYEMALKVKKDASPDLN